MHRVKEATAISCNSFEDYKKTCGCGDYQQAVKTGLITIPFENIKDLNE